MPRGIARTEPGRLNGRQARELARRIRAAIPGARAEAYHIAQGLAGVEVTIGSRRYRIRSEAEWAALARSIDNYPAQ